MTAINVTVRNRVVQLADIITGERQRQALRVAAENIPGVKDVEDNLAWVEPVSGIFVEADRGIRPDRRRLGDMGSVVSHTERLCAYEAASRLCAKTDMPDNFGMSLFAPTDIAEREMDGSPRIAQRSGARVELRALGELAVEFGEQRPVRCEEQLRAGRHQRRVVRDRRTEHREARAG